MMFTDDVVLCAREKALLEVELERWMGIHGKEWNEVSRAKTEYTCLKHSA